MSRRRVLITGITGQTGSYMAELLLTKEYEVYGLIRRTSHPATHRLAACLDALRLIPGDLTDQGSLIRAMKLAEPDEIYNFASQSYVAHSFEAPLHTGDVTGLGALRVFEAARIVCPSARIYQASSSEQFGNPASSPQDEETPFKPVSPYGCAKTFAHYCAQVYRSSYKMYLACGIAFNHESPRRGDEFVTQKIVKSVVAIKDGKMDVLRLGNTAAQRDWCHAKDVVRGAWLALQYPTPEDFVFSSGILHSVQEVVEYTFNYLGLDYHQYVKIDPTIFRPTDIHQLIGNAAKARRLLDWQPTVRLTEILQEMVDAALHSAQPHYSMRTAR